MIFIPKYDFAQKHIVQGGKDSKEVEVKFWDIPLQSLFELKKDSIKDEISDFNLTIANVNNSVRFIVGKIQQDEFYKKFIRTNAMLHLHDPQNNSIAIPKMQKVNIEDSVYMEIQNFHQNVKKTKLSINDLNLSKLTKQKIIQYVAQTTNYTLYDDTIDFISNRYGVLETLYTGLNHFKMSNQQIQSLDKSHMFYEAINTMGHCGYLSIGSILFFEMIQKQTVHKTILSMLQVIRSEYDQIHNGEIKKNTIYVLVQGMLRMYLSAHSEKSSLVSNKKIKKFIDITYARMWELESLLNLGRDELTGIIIMITVIYRIYILVAFMKKPVEVTVYNMLSKPYMYSMKGSFKLISDIFTSIYNQTNETNNIQLDVASISEYIKQDKDFQDLLISNEQAYNIQQQTEIVLYLHDLFARAMQIKLTHTSSNIMYHLVNLTSDKMLSIIYGNNIATIQSVLNNIPILVFGTDAYGGMYDLYQHDDKSYVKINWYGVTSVFHQMVPLVLDKYFQCKKPISTVFWKENSASSELVPGKLILYYGIVSKKGKQYIEQIQKHIKDTYGQSYNEQNKYGFAYVDSIIEFENELIDENIEQYDYILQSFPTHLSLTVPKWFYQSDQDL